MRSCRSSSRERARPFEVARFEAAWARAGGDASELVFATPSTAGEVAALESAFDGVVLTGGPDVNPGRYGAPPEAGAEPRLDPERDALDLAVLERAEREAWPVLAVCYGCQMLNVYHGGTLIQNLDRAGMPGHFAPEPKDRLAHPVRKRGPGAAAGSTGARTSSG